MKAFVVVLVLLVASVVGLGFYRGWFSFASDNADGKSDITFSVDKDKMKKDEKKVAADVHDIGHQATDKAKATATSAKSIDGTLVRISSDELTMTTKAGKDQSHALAANVKVTCDGAVCKAEDLKAGMKVRVTTESDSPHAATRIEALDKNEAFETPS